MSGPIHNQKVEFPNQQYAYTIITDTNAYSVKNKIVDTVSH